PTAALTPATETGPIDSGRIRLKVNGEIRQDGDIADMVWKVPEVIAELSTYYTLRAGDLIFTGTPSGVGAVQRGDELEAEVSGLTPLRVTLI
ncbi:MAG: fumarylacetoacetate hydrolase family protein, partial [Pseudomonadota bacterium]